MSLTQWLLLPIFLHLILVVYVGVNSIRARIASVLKGETKLSAIALNSGNWPPRVRQLGNNFDNQFDVPTTWYALCALLIATGKVDVISATLSWAFVITRYVHTFIHIGTNNVRHRMFAFLAGFGVLSAMWVWFAVKLFLV